MSRAVWRPSSRPQNEIFATYAHVTQPSISIVESKQLGLDFANPQLSMDDPANVRIVTTLGHVDHGKTTLMDALLAANNIISSRMAGKMRYLDSREDEQERGFTMESSAVSLKFQVTERKDDGGAHGSFSEPAHFMDCEKAESSPKTYVVNMVDTPGHVDFSFEVSTASRLCDGALVLVDVVEGVCTQVSQVVSVCGINVKIVQTIAVLRQSWHDRLRPILVINKIDRLVTELKLSPVEAYHHLSRLIEQVNAVMGSFFAGDRMEDDFRWHEERERRLKLKQEESRDIEAAQDEFLDKDDEHIYFAPERGNIVFASAIDGWGFRTSKFAQLYAAKLGMRETNLQRVVWGDYFFDPKTKKVIGLKHLRGRTLRPLFVQFVLDNIWAVYDAVASNPCVLLYLQDLSSSMLTLDQEHRKSQQDCFGAQFKNPPSRPEIKRHSPPSHPHHVTMAIPVNLHHTNRHRCRSRTFCRPGCSYPENALS
jgi:ribosome assembly protein 1